MFRQDVQRQHFLVVAAGRRSEFFTSISQTARNDVRGHKLGDKVFKRALGGQVAATPCGLIAQVVEGAIAAVVLVILARCELHDDALGDIIRDGFAGAVEVNGQGGPCNARNASDIKTPF